MTKRLSPEELMDRRIDARFDRDHKAYERAGRREEAADRKIGELCREGRTVYYVVTRPGKYREGTTRRELIEFLIRNNYV